MTGTLVLEQLLNGIGYGLMLVLLAAGLTGPRKRLRGIDNVGTQRPVSVETLARQVAEATAEDRRPQAASRLAQQAADHARNLGEN